MWLSRHRGAAAPGSPGCWRLVRRAVGGTARWLTHTVSSEHQSAVASLGLLFTATRVPNDGCAENFLQARFGKMGLGRNHIFWATTAPSMRLVTTSYLAGTRAGAMAPGLVDESRRVEMAAKRWVTEICKVAKSDELMFSPRQACSRAS